MSEQKIVVMMPTPEQQRAQLAAEIREMQKNPPDRTIPGGRYLNERGEFIDANGRPIAVEAPVADDEGGGDDADGDAAPAPETARRGARRR